MNLIPAKHMLLVKPIDEDRSRRGVYIPPKQSDKGGIVIRGLVVAAGYSRRRSHVVAGATVIYERYREHEWENIVLLEGAEHLIIHQSDVLATIEEK